MSFSYVNRNQIEYADPMSMDGDTMWGSIKGMYPGMQDALVVTSHPSNPSIVGLQFIMSPCAWIPGGGDRGGRCEVRPMPVHPGGCYDMQTKTLLPDVRQDQCNVNVFTPAAGGVPASCAPRSGELWFGPGTEEGPSAGDNFWDQAGAERHCKVWLQKGTSGSPVKPHIWYDRTPSAKQAYENLRDTSSAATATTDNVHRCNTRLTEMDCEQAQAPCIWTELRAEDEGDGHYADSMCRGSTEYLDQLCQLNGQGDQDLCEAYGFVEIQDVHHVKSHKASHTPIHLAAYNTSHMTACNNDGYMSRWKSTTEQVCADIQARGHNLSPDDQHTVADMLDHVDGDEDDVKRLVITGDDITCTPEMAVKDGSNQCWRYDGSETDGSTFSLYEGYGNQSPSHWCQGDFCTTAIPTCTYAIFGQTKTGSIGEQQQDSACPYGSEDCCVQSYLHQYFGAGAQAVAAIPADETECPLPEATGGWQKCDWTQFKDNTDLSKAFINEELSLLLPPGQNRAPRVFFIPNQFE